MIKERMYEGYIIFDIDSNGDKYESFINCIKYIKIKEILNSNYRGGFDTEHFYFEYLGISLELTYSGFFGTELRIPANCSESDINKVRQLTKEIFAALHKEKNL